MRATDIPRNHADRLLRLADESRKALQVILAAELLDRLGEGATNLDLRFGVRSGYVRGSVLPGERVKLWLGFHRGCCFDLKDVCLERLPRSCVTI